MTARCDHQRAVGFCSACWKAWDELSDGPYSWVDADTHKWRAETIAAEQRAEADKNREHFEKHQARNYFPI